MEIIVEYTLLQNFIIDFLIFKTTAKVLRVKCHFIILASILGAIVALISPLFNLSKIGEFLLKMFLAVLLVSITFSYKKFSSFLKIYLTFFFCTFLYGGVCAFFVQTFGQLSTVIILSIIIVTYFVLGYLIKFVNKRKEIEKFCLEVKLLNEGKTCECKGFLDTGNLLSDPITNKPVNLISYKLFRELFNVDIADILTKKIDMKNLKFAHYINLGTVADSSKVLAFEIDKIVVGEKEQEKPVLALCLKNFKSYEMILHNSFA